MNMIKLLIILFIAKLCNRTNLLEFEYILPFMIFSEN